MDREEFTDSKEENRKEKDQIEQEIQNFESERLNCWTANQTPPPHLTQKETVFFHFYEKIEIKRINQLDRQGLTDSKEENRKEKDQIQ